MEILKKKSVIELVRKAVTAGNKNPSIEQLITLSRAVDDEESYMFLTQASIADKAAVKTCIAVVNGEAPKQVSDQVGNMFGMEGEKESTIASEGQEKIYTPKKVEPTTEEQKDIKERNKVEMEDKYPTTSDRKTDKPSVTEPLKEKVDPEIKKVLDAGEKDPVEKRGSKTAGYKEDEVARLLPVDKYGVQVQLRAGGNATKWMLLDEELLNAINAKKEELLVKGEAAPETEASKKTAAATAHFQISITDPINADKEVGSTYVDGTFDDAVAQLKAYKPYGEQVGSRYNASITTFISKDSQELLASKKTAATEELTTVERCTATSCANHSKDLPSNCKLDAISVDWDEKKKCAYCVNYSSGEEEDMEVSEEEVDTYASRITKGESPKNVLGSFFENIMKRRKAKKARKKMAEMMPGDPIQINDPTTGPMAMTVESVGQMVGTGEPALVAKTDTGESMVIPAGTEISQVMETTVSSKNK